MSLRRLWLKRYGRGTGYTSAYFSTFLQHVGKFKLHTSGLSPQLFSTRWNFTSHYSWFISFFFWLIRPFWTLSNKHMCLIYLTFVNLDNKFWSDIFEEIATKKDMGRGLVALQPFYQHSFNVARKFKLHTFRFIPSAALDTLQISILLKLDAQSTSWFSRRCS